MSAHPLTLVMGRIYALRLVNGQLAVCRIEQEDSSATMLRITEAGVEVVYPKFRSHLFMIDNPATEGDKIGTVPIAISLGKYASMFLTVTVKKPKADFEMVQVTL
jgi:hypothetical protein